MGTQLGTRYTTFLREEKMLGPHCAKWKKGMGEEDVAKYH